MHNYSYTITINNIKVNECIHELDTSSTARICKHCGIGLPFNRDWTWVNPIDHGTNGWGLNITSGIPAS